MALHASSPFLMTSGLVADKGAERIVALAVDGLEGLRHFEAVGIRAKQLQAKNGCGVWEVPSYPRPPLLVMDVDLIINYLAVTRASQMRGIHRMCFQR